MGDALGHVLGGWVEGLNGMLAVLLFSSFNKLFFGYFEPQKIFVDNEHK